ncbi:MAG: hypothetical protein QM784_10445 [Polyangiaceae bacterium]
MTSLISRIVGASALLSVVCVAGCKESKVDNFEPSPFAVDYLKMLDELKKKYDLDEVELKKQVMAIHFPEQLFLKSGLGDLGGPPYPDRVVQNDLKLNNITIDARAGKRWTGESYRVSELVLLEDSEVVYSKRYTGTASRDLTLVLFQPDRVEFFGWKNFEGGSFKRQPKR